MKSYKLVLIFIAIILAISICFIFLFFGVQNKAISLEEQITTALSEIQIQEKRRSDLIPNLVDCVKEYDNHEYETMIGIIEARGSNSDDVAEEVQTMLNVVAESYPELKSSDNYKNLMNELSITENKIASVRSNYNIWVTKYNSFVKQFPNNKILEVTGYEKQNFEKMTFNVDEDAPNNLFSEE